ncbi:hypothetical protein TB2_008578 [Malus domestica]
MLMPCSLCLASISPTTCSFPPAAPGHPATVFSLLMEPRVPPLPFGLEDEGGSGVDFAAGLEEGFRAGRFHHLLIREQPREVEEEEMQQADVQLEVNAQLVVLSVSMIYLWNWRLSVS